MPVWRSINGLAVLLCGGLVLAAEPADRIPATPADTIVITSQSLVFKNQENMAVFDGKVAMTKVGFIMHADHMIVHFAGASEIATPAPLNVYGRIKLEIEQAMLAAGQTVVRTTGVFGREPPPGKNFVLSLIASLRRGQRVRVASDQLTTPTWSDDLARAAVAVAERGGIWNAVGPDLLARDAFARLVASTFELDGSLIDSLPTSALEQHARRPLSSGLRTEKLVAFLGASLTPTRTALRQFKDQFRLEDTPPLH